MRSISLIALLSLLLSAAAYAGGGELPRHGGEEKKEGEAEPDILIPLDEGVVFLEIPGVASQDIVAQYANDTLFLPYLFLCDFLRVPATVSSDQMVLDGAFPVGEPFILSRGERRAHRGRTDIVFEDGDIRLVNGEIYIRHTLLFSLLGLDARFNLSRLTLTIPADERLPVVQWSRSRGRAASLLGDESDPFALLESASPPRRLLGPPIIDWTVTHAVYAGRSTGGGNLALGGGFLFGELELGISGGLRRQEMGQPVFSLDRGLWRYYAPEFSPVRQITLGTMSVADAPGYGLELSNVPLATRSLVGEHDIVGQTQPGWNVELYDGRRLTDAVQADSLGYYRFRVPVGYGIVDRTLKFIGPYGETMFEDRRVQLSQGILPVGEFQYTVRGNAARLDALSPVAAAGRFGFGVFKRLTIGADLEMRPSLPGEITPESVAARASAVAWLGSSSSLSLYYGIGSRLAGGQFYAITPGNMVFRGGIDSLALDGRSFRGEVEATVPAGGISFSAAGRLERQDGWYMAGASPRISGYFAGLNFIASADLLWAQDSSGLREGMPAPREIRSVLQMIATPFAGTLLKGEGAYDHLRGRLSRIDLYAYARLNDYVALGAGYSMPGLDWKRGEIRAQVEFQFSPARIFFDAGWQQGVTSLSTMARGSAIVSGAGVTPSPEYAIGKSAVVVRAFRDDNGNGERDAGEEDLPAPQASLALGRMRMRSQRGIFTSLASNMEWHVEVDRWQYAAEGLYPTRVLHRLYLLPSSVATVDVPYREGAELTGRCTVEEILPDGGRKPVPPSATNGLRLLLVAEGSASYYDGEIFPDGTVLVSGVAQGRYKLRFDAAQLAARHLSAPSADQEIVLDGTSDRLPPITLIRK